MRSVLAALTVFASLSAACAADTWHHPLYLANGGLWRQRLALEVRNTTAAAYAGEPAINLENLELFSDRIASKNIRFATDNYSYQW